MTARYLEQVVVARTELKYAETGVKANRRHDAANVFDVIIDNAIKKPAIMA